MTAQTIYMMNGQTADPAIYKGLVDAGYEVRGSHSIAETLDYLREAFTRTNTKSLMLVADVQAGAITLLTMLREAGVTFPPTLLLDQEGDCVQTAIKALKLGVQDYVLASEPPSQRELHARVMAERILASYKVRPWLASVSKLDVVDTQQEGAALPSSSTPTLSPPWAYL